MYEQLASSTYICHTLRDSTMLTAVLLDAYVQQINCNYTGEYTGVINTSVMTTRRKQLPSIVADFCLATQFDVHLKQMKLSLHVKDFARTSHVIDVSSVSSSPGSSPAISSLCTAGTLIIILTQRTIKDMFDNYIMYENFYPHSAVELIFRPRCNTVQLSLFTYSS